MISPQVRGVFSACWIAAVVITFFAVEASSSRSWMYLAIGAFMPPAVLLGVWRDDQSETIAAVMRGPERRS